MHTFSQLIDESVHRRKRGGEEEPSTLSVGRIQDESIFIKACALLVRVARWCLSLTRRLQFKCADEAFPPGEKVREFVF